MLLYQPPRVGDVRFAVSVFCSTHVWGRRLAVSASLRWFSGYLQLCTCSVSRSIRVDRAVVAVPLVPLPAPSPQSHTPPLNFRATKETAKPFSIQYQLCSLSLSLSRFIYLFFYIVLVWFFEWLPPSSERKPLRTPSIVVTSRQRFSPNNRPAVLSVLCYHRPLPQVCLSWL